MKKTIIALALGTAVLWAAPASATFNWGGSSGGHSTSGGHWGGSSGGSSGHWGGSTGGSSGHWGGSTGGSSGHWGGSTGGSSGHHGSSGGSSGNHGSSGGTQVPEPGMLGMFGLGLAGIGFARRRRRRA